MNEAEAKDVDRDRHAANELLEDIARRASLPSGKDAKDALAAVMCSFGQHVSRGEARQVWSELPSPIRALLEDELARRVGEHLGVSPDEALRTATAVLRAISAHLPPKEVLDVASQLPPDLRELWMERPVELPETHPIFAEIAKRTELPEGVDAARAFAVVIGKLSRRVTGGEARHLSKALPADVRPILEPSIRDREERPERFGREELLSTVARELHTDRPERIARAVIHAVEKFLSRTAFKHVRSQLPADLNELWTSPA
jgi:uncharacterized protein (DUF2267 family)